MVAARWTGLSQRGTVDRPAAQATTGTVIAQCDPLPASNCQAGTIATATTDTAERGRDDHRCRCDRVAGSSRSRPATRPSAACADRRAV